ncbi:MAG TPA: hypothetical protein PKE47_07135, partial [Verrucomicrobiota bacterium]|nr:hypothetical protein [Verrucomicrobiota bacterium]
MVLPSPRGQASPQGPVRPRQQALDGPDRPPQFGSQRLAREGLIGHAQFFSYCLIPLSVGMFPHLFQHWLTAKSAKSFRLTVVAHPLCIMVVWLPCILIGLWATAQLGGQASPNAVLGRMVSQFVHSPVLTGIVAAGVLAAIMSSLDSQFMCLGTMFTHDVVMRRYGKGRFSDREQILMARGFILLVVLITYLLALYLRDSAHVFDLGVWCFSGFAALFPLAWAAVYWRRATRAGAVASLLAGVVAWVFLFSRDILSKRGGAAGDDELLIWGFMPVAFLFAITAGALVVGSLLTAGAEQETPARVFPAEAAPPPRENP